MSTLQAKPALSDRVAKKDGKERKKPIEFRKVAGSWKIELPMSPL